MSARTTEIKVPDTLAQPEIHPEAWVAPNAIVVGRVILRRGAAVWYNCVLRSDLEDAWIEVGEDTNIQDGTVIHVDEGFPCRIGARVTVGHGAVLHAVEVEDDALIGMGAIVLTGARVGSGSVVAAGALVPENVHVPPGVIVAGVPAKVRREMTDADRARHEAGWKAYAALRELHRRGGR
jgi:carbonic anhydrase/acetyltransferase-like protein (isoleucine patch superfamily)